VHYKEKQCISLQANTFSVGDTFTDMQACTRAHAMRIRIQMRLFEYKEVRIDLTLLLACV